MARLFVDDRKITNILPDSLEEAEKIRATSPNLQDLSDQFGYIECREIVLNRWRFPVIRADLSQMRQRQRAKRANETITGEFAQKIGELAHVPWREVDATTLSPQLLRALRNLPPIPQAHHA